MEKLNKELTDNISSINKCIIHYGDYLLNSHEDIIFDKKLSKQRFDSLLSKFVTSDYSVNRKKVYNYKNYFYDITSKYAFKKTNFSNFDTDYKNLLIEIYNEVDIGYANFSCKRDYHNIYEYELTRIKLCPEINLNFIQESNYYTFSIEINVDHNIDNTIIKLNKILNML
tara:strand:+ start:139 stop:648 length:510 start_codon:yes stop_codon:yes gene_type:complete